MLTSAGVKWRQFKTFLTNKYVLPKLGDKKALRRPLKAYNFVGLEAWKDFVKQRSTKEWEVLHSLLCSYIFIIATGKTCNLTKGLYCLLVGNS